MNNETTNKFAAILAAAQAKAQSKNTAPLPIPQPQKEAEKPQPIEQPQQDTNTVLPSKMSLFHILWQEGSGKYDGKTFTTWFTANQAMTKIYEEHSGLGYLKVKINVKWGNGCEITDRADCSDSEGDFCPKRGTIGQYLSKRTGVMYQSNVEKGTRNKLSFEDHYLGTEELQKVSIADYVNSPNVINDIAQDEEEMSNTTIADLLGEPDHPQSKLQYVDYSERSFAIIGETKPIKDQLRSLGGSFNAHLKCGAGWIFSKTRLATVKSYLAI